MLRTIIIGLLLVSSCSPLLANDGVPVQQEPYIHWALGSFLGTGWYKVDDYRSVFILRIPPRQTVRKSWFNSRDDRQIGIEIKYNTTLGLFALDDIPSVIDDDNFGTISFTPGVELEIPVTRDFYLRPFAHVGWGTEFESSSSAWIWFGGLKSRYRIPKSENTLAIIGNIYYGGFNASDSESDELSGLGLGMEGSIPFRNWSFGDTHIDLDWHWMYTQFNNGPLLDFQQGDPIELESMLEIGLGLSPRKGRWNLPLWQPERLGLGVKWDPDTDFMALTINFTSWFRR